MKLTNLVIRNYRSINEIKCEVDPKITILAGKNESGKTNILEALETFNNTSQFHESDKPIGYKDKIPEIELIFSLDKGDLELIKSTPLALSKDDVPIPFELYLKECPKEVIVKKMYGENDFQIISSFIKFNINYLKCILPSFMGDYNKSIQTFDKKNNEIKISTNVLPFAVDENNRIEDLTVTNIKDRANQLNVFKLNHPNINVNSIEHYISYLLKIIIAINNIESDTKKFLPKFILFSGFEDQLPFKVPISEIIDENNLKKNQRIVYDLLRLTEFPVEVFKTKDDRLRSSAAINASSRFSTNFDKFWQQDDILIKFEDKDNNLLIWFYDKGINDRLFEFQQRSKGLQWYVSFYIRLKSQGYDKNSIILIDEPGANLHAKAQKDVLNLLENISNENQIIFSTHSTYLFDPDKLHRVRLVVKDENSKQTNLFNKYNTGSDYDTLTPIITAIGLDISRTLSFSKDMNILLEGVSDYYYLTSILEYIKKEKSYEFPATFSFIPSIGHTKIPYLVSILMGWGFDFCVLLDRKGTNKTYNMLLDEGINDELIIFVGKDENESIEDLISQKDRTNNNISIYNEKDWNKWKKVKKEKSLIAKQFAVNSRKADFSLTDITQNNFLRIFDKIKNTSK